METTRTAGETKTKCLLAKLSQRLSTAHYIKNMDKYVLQHTELQKVRNLGTRFLIFSATLATQYNLKIPCLSVALPPLSAKERKQV